MRPASAGPVTLTIPWGGVAARRLAAVESKSLRKVPFRVSAYTEARVIIRCMKTREIIDPADEG
jgi:hypothetical protein